jgi:transposase-like protein
MKPVKMNSNPTSENWQGPNEVPVEGAHRATGAGTSLGDKGILVFPDPEVQERKTRRNFTASYKLRILQEVDKCSEPGQIGRLLRREGLYSSHLTTWRRARDKGVLQAMKPRKRGRKLKERNPLTSEVARLQKENRKLENKLKQAELIIEAQKKISQLLGITQAIDENNGSAL